MSPVALPGIDHGRPMIPPLPSRRYREDWLPSIPESPAASFVLHHLADFYDDGRDVGKAGAPAADVLEPYVTLLRALTKGTAIVPPDQAILIPSTHHDPAVRFYADLTVVRFLSRFGSSDNLDAILVALMDNPWYDSIHGYAVAAHHSGLARRGAGANDDAILLFQDSDVCHQAIGNHIASATARLELGRSLLDTGDIAMAKEMFEASRSLFDVHGTRRNGAIAEAYSAIACDPGEYRDAIRSLGRIVDDADNGLEESDRRMVLGWVTRFYRDLGAIDSAVACSDRIGRLGQDAVPTLDEWGLLLLRVDVLSLAGRHDEATRLLDNVYGRRLGGSAATGALEAEIALRRAEILERRADSPEVTHWYEEAVRLARGHSPTDLEVSALRAVIRRYRTEGRRSDATTMAVTLMEVQERLIDERRRSSGRMLELRMAYDTRVRDLALEQERNRSRTVIETHEHVSNRIASGLQDRVGSILDDCLRMFQELAHVPQQQRPTFATVSGLLRRTLSEVRTIAHELSSVVLHEQGLSAALASLVHDVTVPGGPNLRYHGPDAPRELAPDVALAIYRSIQTLLVNALVHAGATTIDLALDIQDETVVVHLTDDGRGFDPTTVRKGMGLRDADVRMAIVGGTVDVTSAPGAGTRIVITVPRLPAGG